MPSGAPGAPRDPSSHRPRVAVVTHVFPPWTGGAEFYHQLLSRRLSESSEVCVFTADYLLRPGSQGGRTIDTVPSGPLDAPYRIRYLPSWRFFGENLLRPGPLFQALREFDPDVIWANCPSLSADESVLWGTLRKVPWVATYHADLDETHLYARPYTAWEGRLLRTASAILVTTTRYADRLARRGVSRERVHVIPLGPGIGLGTLPEVDEQQCVRGTAPGPEHPLLFVGGLDWGHSYKRPERLLEAIGKLRASGLDIHAWIVGDGDRRAELEAAAVRAGLTSSVRFLGRLTDAELACRLHSAWLLVLTSTETEGFGVVAAEAMHYGCPVLTSDGPGIGPMLADAGSGIVYRRQEPESLERALRELWTDPGRRNQLAERTAAAAGLFDWGRALPELTRPILDLAAEHARSAR
jgi:glycosyltransferase involved in cell wall biosynthesis